MSLKGECESKPNGVVRDKSGTTLETMELEPGFFRFSAASTEIYACHHVENCKGGIVHSNGTEHEQYVIKYNFKSKQGKV